MKKIFLVLISILLLSGCGSAKINFKDNSTKKVYLAYKVDSIEIVDSRTELLPMGWDVPLFAIKEKEWVGNPEISIDNRMDITMILRQSQDIEGPNAHLTFKVLEGICKLSGKWNLVKEYAKFKCELIVDVPTKNVRHTYRGVVEYDLPVKNGTEEHTILLYNLAVKNGTHKVVSELATDLKSIGN